MMQTMPAHGLMLKQTAHSCRYGGAGTSLNMHQSGSAAGHKKSSNTSVALHLMLIAVQSVTGAVLHKAVLVVYKQRGMYGQSL